MRARFAEIVAAPADGYDVVCAALPGGYTEVGSPDELRRWLRQIAAECPRPLLAEVVRTDGDRLTIGLGRARSLLTYIPEDGDPPYFSVVGEAPEGEAMNFDCNRESSFYSARNTVPFDVALEVVCRFAESSGLPLPEMVVWEES
jgi:Immunity protein Imm1